VAKARIESRPRAQATPRIDGRTARAHRTRAAILDALLDLIEGGNLHPTAAEVATRAGVALRSIRQHFESRETLFVSASQRHAERMRAEAGPAPTAHGPTSERVAAFVGARAKELEASSALRRSATLREASSAALTAALRGPARDRRRQIEHVFAAELDGVADARARAGMLDALDLVAGGRAWDALRRDLGRSCAEAERVMATALRALCDAATRQRGASGGATSA
jgi:AcrR family transcriptional regulator